MLRRTAVALFALFFSVASSHAAVIVTASPGASVPDLPGYTSYTITATSTFPGEQIQGVDFAWNGSNDPATGHGFFGAMNQLGPPAVSTIYLDQVQQGDLLFPGRVSLEDSHFLINSGAANVAHPNGFDEEGPDILQGIWAWSAPQGQSVAFAQLVIPTGGTVFFRGSFALNSPAGIFDSQIVSGTIPEPSTLAALAMGALASVFAVGGRNHRRLHG